MAVAGQMHGLVALDAAGAVIRPAILWNDGRAAAETEALNRDPGRAALTAWTGNIAFPGFTAPKLLWMRSHEPEKFRRIAKIMLPKDYLTWYLTGSFATDFSDAAGTLFLDTAHRRWSAEMLALCGLTETALPALYESFAPVGTLRPEIARELGLSEKVLVAAGAGDNAAAAVGTGAVTDGACNLSIGTSGTLLVSSDTFCVDGQNALHSFCHANGKFLLLGCILSAAACNSWWCDILGQTDFDAVQGEIPPSLLGQNSLFFLPYLMGERAPHNDPHVRGTFLGLDAGTTRAHMTLAVLEGVAFALRDCLEAARALGLAPARSTLCGGGAKSPLWRRILANVLNLELVLPAVEEGPAYGAAMLAAVAAGAFPSVEEAAASLVHYTEAIAPEQALAAAYDTRYRRYQTLYPAIAPLFAPAH